MSLEASFVFVTGNLGKLQEAERILGFRPRHEKLDLPEIQSLDILEIVRAKANEAWRRLGEAVMVDETGLALGALSGFPGPLVKWMAEAIGPEGIARTAHRLGDTTAIAQCAMIYRDGEHELVAQGDVPGLLVSPPRGEGGFGWDPIFQPAGEERTYAQLSSAEKDKIGHRGKALRQLHKALSRVFGEDY